jgi:predicted ATP-grasp superfamily ATP-dependent carboligase
MTIRIKIEKLEKEVERTSKEIERLKTLLEADNAPYLRQTKEPIRVERYGSVRLPVYK